MGDIRLTLACEDYDRTRALRDRVVKPDGIELNYLTLPVEEIFWRMLHYEEFDVAEMSMGAFHVDASRGRLPFVAIPVFPSRMFRHRCIFVNVDSGIERPQDLKGKKVGVPEYTMTASVWLRGTLQHDFSVIPKEVHWIQGGVEQPGRKDRVEFEPPPDIRLDLVEDKTLNEMLETGEIDALMTARMPACFVHGSPRVRRLFQDFKTVEMDYFRRTAIFPIMHVMVVRAAVSKENPWICQSLYKAFCEAKDICLGQIYDSNVMRTSLPWSLSEFEEVRSLMTEDFWPYGFEANRKVLETFHSYLLEQGMIKTPLKLETLFAPNTLEAFKI